MKQAILLNGVPASGKSRLGGELLPLLAQAGFCAVPLTLDTIKEGLFSQIGTGDRDHNRMLGRASYHAIFNTIAAFPDDLMPVVDAWHGFQPRAVLQSHLDRAGIERVVEIWCAVTPQTAAARYRARAGERDSGHLPASYADELFTLAQTARPMGFGPVIEVDGAAAMPVDLSARILAELRA